MRLSTPFWVALLGATSGGDRGIQEYRGPPIATLKNTTQLVRCCVVALTMLRKGIIQIIPRSPRCLFFHKSVQSHSL